MSVVYGNTADPTGSTTAIRGEYTPILAVGRHGTDHGISQQTLYASSDSERFHGAARAGLHECSGDTESDTRVHRHGSID